MGCPRRAWPTERPPTSSRGAYERHAAPCPRRNTQRRSPPATLSETFAEKVTVVGAEAGMNFVVWLKLGGVRAASQAGGEPGPTDLRGVAMVGFRSLKNIGRLVSTSLSWLCPAWSLTTQRVVEPLSGKSEPTSRALGHLRDNPIPKFCIGTLFLRRKYL